MSTFIMAPDFLADIDSNGALLGGSLEAAVPLEETLFGLSYWDTVTYVRPLGMLAPNISASSEIIAFQSAGCFSGAGYPAYGMQDYMTQSGTRTLLGPEALRINIAATITGMNNLLVEVRSNWTISSRSKFQMTSRDCNSVENLLVSIHSAVPIVGEIPNADTFLRWRDDHRDELRRIRQSAEVISAQTDEASVEGVTKEIVRGLMDACEKTSRHAKEVGMMVTLGDLSVSITPRMPRLRSFFDAASCYGGFSAMFLPNLAALGVAVTAGASAEFSVTKSSVPAIKGSSAGFPYEQYSRIRLTS